MPDPIKLPLHDLHERHGARFGEFAGYDMPMRYDEGAVAEHQWCRTSAALFDVSHMGVFDVYGPDAAAALETLIPVSLIDLEENRGRYGFLTNDRGGVLDDLIITNRGDRFQLVVNAGTKQADLAHVTEALGDSADVSRLLPMGILALQGPEAAAVLELIAPAANELRFGWGMRATVAGADVWVSRSGYTGEDGFELIVGSDAVRPVADALLSDRRVRPAGLAARDSLRLEAGLCLYGHELTPDITPIEAGLTWAIQKRRRAEGGFPGSETIMRQLSEGTGRVRVGLVSDRRPVREGATLSDEAGSEVGFVTSGGFGPTYDGPIAMGYLPPGMSEAGTRMIAAQRGKNTEMTVSELPFVRHNYYRG